MATVSLFGGGTTGIGTMLFGASELADGKDPAKPGEWLFVDRPTSSN